MSDYINFKKITKEAILNKYKITEPQFKNLQKRFSEKIINAKKLYRWTNEDTPSITQLIDYSLKNKKFKNEKFEVILQTPSTKTPSLKAKRHALDVITGESGDYARGFYTFSSGIKQFITMKRNAEIRLTKQGQNKPLEKLEHFQVGKKISISAGYYFKNNQYGRESVQQLNRIIDNYNAGIEATNQSNALSYYINFQRLMMNVINISDEHDAIAGS